MMKGYNMSREKWTHKSQLQDIPGKLLCFKGVGVGETFKQSGKNIKPLITEKQPSGFPRATFSLEHRKTATTQSSRKEEMTQPNCGGVFPSSFLMENTNEQPSNN